MSALLASNLFESLRLKVSWLGQQPYQSTFDEMIVQVKGSLLSHSHKTEDNLSSVSTAQAKDVLWLLEHESTYTLGARGKRSGILCELPHPVVHTDRGGDITYHGPGQLIAYPIINLQRLGLSAPEFVHHLEALLIQLLLEFGIKANSDPKRPGVYYQDKKIASIGLRCKRSKQAQVCYHGLALNIAMDLAPFLAINPCGYSGLEMTQLNEHLAEPVSTIQVSKRFARLFVSWYETLNSD